MAAMRAFAVDRVTDSSHLTGSSESSETTKHAVTASYAVHWVAEKGIYPEGNTEHRIYINQFCADFSRCMHAAIDRAAAARSAFQTDPLCSEVAHHTEFVKTRAASFYGQELILCAILAFLPSDASPSSSIPVMLVGESGAGKTSIMAKVAMIASLRLPTCVIVARFLGTSRDSCTIARLLPTLCAQISRAYGQPDTVIHADLSSLIALFHSRLALATAERPLVLIIDAVDQLTDPVNLVWIPRTLPPHVAMFVTLLPSYGGHVDGCIPLLRGAFGPDVPILSVSRLTTEDAKAIFDASILAASRTLTSSQQSLVVSAWSASGIAPLPLLLRLSVDQAKRWHSYSALADCRMGTNVPLAIQLLFSLLERDHGEVFVRHALGYLTAAQHGLSTDELEDVLSCDDAVLSSVFEWWLPPVRRIPPILWARVRQRLGDFLVRRRVS